MSSDSCILSVAYSASNGSKRQPIQSTIAIGPARPKPVSCFLSHLQQTTHCHHLRPSISALPPPSTPERKRPATSLIHHGNTRLLPSYFKTCNDPSVSPPPFALSSMGVFCHHRLQGIAQQMCFTKS
jgi:hypothetical protein